MNVIRKRAKEHFPTVLLTLLSMVQALALELLWSRLHQSDYLYELTFIAALSWLQVVATFLGLLIIWVVYASTVMRFRWVPATMDSVFPFVIGLLEFMLIETLGPDDLGFWFIFMGLIFGAMNWTSHTTMRLARLDGDNEFFFKDVAPAQWSDFYLEVAIVSALILSGLYFLLTGSYGIVAMVAIIMTTGLLCWQFHTSSVFWKRSVAEVQESEV